jgi:hypothetical protein
MGDARFESSQAADHLDRLGQWLTGAGYLVMLVSDGPRTRLEVMHRTVRERHGNVLCETAGDRWWFWWSWGERISPADAVQGAAQRIDRLLRVPEAA